MRPYPAIGPGMVIRLARTARNMSQIELAKAIHASIRTICEWECGKLQVHARYLGPLVETLGVNGSDIRPDLSKCFHEARKPAALDSAPQALRELAPKPIPTAYAAPNLPPPIAPAPQSKRVVPVSERPYRKRYNLRGGKVCTGLTVARADIERWDAYCEAHRITRSEFIARAAELLIKIGELT